MRKILNQKENIRTGKKYVRKILIQKKKIVIGCIKRTKTV